MYYQLGDDLLAVAPMEFRCRSDGLRYLTGPFNNFILCLECTPMTPQVGGYFEDLKIPLPKKKLNWRVPADSYRAVFLFLLIGLCMMFQILKGPQGCSAKTSIRIKMMRYSLPTSTAVFYFFSEASVRCTRFAHAVLFFWVVSTILALLQTCVFVSLCKGCL